MAGPTQEQILQAFCSFVAAGSGLGDEKVCIWGGPRPALPYAVVKEFSPGVSAHREERIDQPDGTIVIRYHKRSVYQVDVLAPGPNQPDFNAGPGFHPTDYLTALEAAKDQSSPKAALHAIGATVVAVGAPMDLTRLVDTEHEYRAVSRVTVAYRWESDPVDESTIEEVEGSFGVSGVDTVMTAEPD